MSRKTIRLALVGHNDEQKNHVLNILGREFDCIEDKENPEYIIVFSHWKFDKDENMDYFYKNYENTITIYFGDEAALPDFNFFDYVICYDDIQFSDRYAKMTPISGFYERLHNKSITYKEAKELLYQKKYFCNFIYSNAKAHKMRDTLFHEISKYKFVHALGKHLRNCDIEIPGRNDYITGGIEAKKDFKFSIAAENNWYRDGVTEKIATSMLAYTVPIYFGDNNVGKRLNAKSFINYHDYENMDDLIKRLKEVDENDELWCEIICEPWQTDKQYELTKDELKNYSKWLINIFRQDITKAKRKPEGTYTDYDKECSKNIFYGYVKYSKIINKLVWLIPIKYIRDYIRDKIKDYLNK